MNECVIGVDIGSSRIKALAFDASGGVAAHAAVETPRITRGGTVDFPVLAMIEAAAAVTRDVARAAPVVRGIGVTSMGEVGTILHNGALADLAFPSWHDERGEDVVRDIAALAAELDAHHRTGAHLRPVSTVAKLGWLSRQTEVPSGTFMVIASAFAWTLTGAPAQERSLATTLGVVSPWDGEVLDRLWDAAGLGAYAIAPIHRTGMAHPVTPSAAQILDLPGGIPVVVAGHDHPVAAVGTGAPLDAVVDSLGTGEPLLAPLQDRPALDSRFPPPHMSVETSPATGGPLVISEGLRPGLAMDALLRASGVDRSRLDAQLDVHAADVLTADAVAALEHGDVRMSADAQGWSQLHAHLVGRAHAADAELRRVTGATGPTVLTGGGLRSRGWVSMKAQRASHPLLVSTATETAARGAAAIVGVAAGWWDAPEAMPGATLVEASAWRGELG
ncbi:FGGY family carbohydrate kinase [uncultured Demequina sp.]|uniref:FGGY family carbohydrate kinase n=1 Tax=uncultured Demequina sp. TaxID=693499 RepID=UPI0025D48861|nr:FGGY family carbohydrate kinase [uncultured Demequina sp.]